MGWRWATEPWSRTLPGELLIGLGAFVLVVLPIRAVLVPSDVSGLTVVDYALGAEMAVMVVITLMLALASAPRATIRLSGPKESTNRKDTEASIS